MVRVLVTGASGFIAGHVIRELVENGYAVRGTVRDPAARDKVAHLPDSVELVQVDLDRDEGWAEAVAGCQYVMHVASPFPSGPPRDEDELIRPAVEGTLRVLRAAADSDTVERVVLTSSIAAITSGRDRHDTTVHTEQDWADLEHSAAYAKSKTLAERAAWDFVAEHPRLELVVVNPGLVLGPVLRSESTTSTDVVRMLLARSVPGSPRLAFAPVDVRDIAIGHRLAMERPEAAGKRYILAGDQMWMNDIAKVLAAEFNPKGYHVPTGRVPYWLMWIMGRFNQTVRLGLDLMRRPEHVSARQAERDLGWSMRPVRESIVDTGRSLIEHGVVPVRGQAKPARAG
jgi:nucleoside-diphosphate-sugar epimerase